VSVILSSLYFELKIKSNLSTLIPS